MYLMTQDLMVRKFKEITGHLDMFKNEMDDFISHYKTKPRNPDSQVKC